MFKSIKTFLLTNTSPGQTIVKNTFWLFVGEIISRILKMVLVIYAARLLGTSGWGAFSYALSLASLLYIFSDFGLEGIVTREMSKESESRLSYLSTAFFIRIVMIIFCLSGIFAITLFMDQSSEIKIILLPIALSLAFDSIRNLSLSISRSLEQMEQEAYLRSIGSLFTAIFGISVLILYPSVVNLSYAYLAGSIVGFIASWRLLQKYFLLMPAHFSAKFIFPVLKISWPFFVFGATATVMTYTDIIMLGWWRTQSELGLYSASQRLVQFMVVIPNLIAMATLPVFSKFIEQGKERLRYALEKTLSMTFMLALPMISAGIILGDQIVSLIFGEAYAGSVLVFQIFSAMLLATFPMVIISSFIFTHNIHKKFVLHTIGVALLNIILNFIFIHKYGIYGAAVATAFSNFFLAVLIWVITKRKNYFEVLPHLNKIIIATLLMSFAVVISKQLGFGIFINIAVCVITYACMLYTLKEPMLAEIKKIILSK
jgi:O-antigen/teichoic acid export membrane protein